jgi:hypothetical protein
VLLSQPMGRFPLTRPAFVALGLLLAAVGAPAALGGGGPPQDVSAISQYVETLPTSAGPRTVGSASGQTPLSAASARKVSREGGRDAKTLVKIATSRRLGAPGRVPGQPTTSLLSKLDRRTSPTFLGGAGASVDSLSGLLVVLVVLTAAAGGAAALRRRTSRTGSG